MTGQSPTYVQSEKKRTKEGKQTKNMDHVQHINSEKKEVCVCVCERESERGREREGEREGEGERETRIMGERDRLQGEMRKTGGRETADPDKGPTSKRARRQDAERASGEIREGQCTSGNHGQSRQRTHKGPVSPTWTSL